jgi:hypothetical protein
MVVITVHYTCKYQIKFAPEYKFTLCGLCYNSKSGRLIKQVLKNSCIGYIIQGKFKSLTYLRTKLEKIPKYNIPF